MTDIAYKNLTLAEKIFKDLVWNPGILAGQLALEIEIPFLSLPIIRTIESGLINKFSDWLFNQFVVFVDVTAIRLVNSAHQVAYDSASLKLKVIAHDKGIDSNEFLEAREAAKLALSRFTQFSR